MAARWEKWRSFYTIASPRPVVFPLSWKVVFFGLWQWSAGGAICLLVSDTLQISKSLPTFRTIVLPLPLDYLEHRRNLPIRNVCSMYNGVTVSYVVRTRDTRSLDVSAVMPPAAYGVISGGSANLVLCVSAWLGKSVRHCRLSPRSWRILSDWVAFFWLRRAALWGGVGRGTYAGMIFLPPPPPGPRYVGRNTRSNTEWGSPSAASQRYQASEKR
jgi:hypothetical protein